MERRMQSVTAHKEQMLKLGSLVEDKADIYQIRETYLQLEANERAAEFLTPFAHIRQTFCLSMPEAVVLANCAYRAYQLLPMPIASEICTIVGMFGSVEKEVSFLLYPADSGYESLMIAIDFLLERNPKLPEHIKIIVPESAPVFHSQEILDEMALFLEQWTKQEESATAAIALLGENGSGKKFLFSQLALNSGYGFMLVQADKLEKRELPAVAVAAILYDCLVCVKSFENKFRGLLEQMCSWLGIVLLCCLPQALCDMKVERLLVRRTVPLTQIQRAKAMKAYMGEYVLAEELDAAVKIYKPNMGRIVSVTARLRAEYFVHGARQGVLASALRAENAPALAENAKLLVTKAHIDDLVLPAEQKEMLKSLCGFVRVQDTVYRQWGFGDKISYGHGVSALFYGTSGTGKTMAASVVANELELPMYRADLSKLMSKYIGETQKNIGKIFDDAQNSDCILFFDEADALFSRRTETGDAQDKYANAEIAYLLERMEYHEGLILLATNLLQNFDEAFRRRITFMLHFPRPDEKMCEVLWEKSFPDTAPIEKLDYALLAKELELSGAEIKNSAVNAARLAAWDGERIGMGEVLTAVQMEYQKQGKPFPQNMKMYL